MSVVHTIETPPQTAVEDCEIIFHESPAVFVRIADGTAKLHAYLSGFDVETTDTAGVRHLARCLSAASEAVDLLNARRNGGD